MFLEMDVTPVIPSKANEDRTARSVENPPRERPNA